MALTDSAVIIPGTGYVYLAPSGTAKPSSLTVPPTPWDNIGHTSRDNGLTITRDGGDSNILGTWQNPVLRDRRDPITFAITMGLLQVSNAVLELYFGGGDKSVVGTFGVPLVSTPVERAMFVRIIDGAYEAPLYIPKVAIASDDDVSVDVEAFLEFPVRATVLGVTGSNLLEFYGIGLGLDVNEVQLVTITGTPTGGTFTLSYAGQTTAGIVYNAAATAVQTALLALSSIGTGNVVVTGAVGGPYTVTFQGTLAGTDVAQMTANSSGLTGGTTPTVTVTTVTPGN